MKTTVTVKFEVHTDGKQTNIECYTVSSDSFLADSAEFNVNLIQCMDRTRKEIIDPTPKTDMN